MNKFNRLFVISLLFSFFFMSGCSSRIKVKPGEIPVAVPPTAEVQATARNYVQGFLQQTGYSELSKKTPQYLKVERITKRILSSAGLDPKIFPLSVADAGEDVNAMVLQGSSIIVFKQLVDRTSEEELAVVLAHEVGHLLGNHAALHEEEKKRGAAVSMFSSILGTVASVAASAAGYQGVSDIAGNLTEGVTGAVGYGAFVGSFSREQEYEADHIGLMLMAKAGYDPKVAPQFWDRSEEVFGSKNSEVGAFFGTHPAERDRSEALREYLPLALQYYTPVKPGAK